MSEISQTERVPDEELDQMIWKLERDGGMTPKLLSLMWEVREVRRANAEKLNQPVSETNLAVAQIKPVADLYGITSPTGSETTFTFDAREASGFAGSGWSVQEYVELERYQEAVAGNSPVTTDAWIPVSERMPEGMTDVNISNGFGVGQGWWDGDCWQTQHDYYAVPGEVTHWMPLPATPQEVKSALEMGMVRHGGAMQEIAKREAKS